MAQAKGGLDTHEGHVVIDLLVGRSVTQTSTALIPTPPHQPDLTYTFPTSPPGERKNIFCKVLEHAVWRVVNISLWLGDWDVL